MLFKCGLAAFLASVTMAFSVGSATAAAPSSTIACFTPANADLIGRLGPNHPGVVAAFEAGACLALPAGVPVANVQHSGAMWQFRALGAAPALYAADWGAGFTGSGNDQMIAAFNRFLPVTGRLLEAGSGFADCYDASERYSARWRDLERRWRAYDAYGSTRNVHKVVLYMGPEFVKLSEEYHALEREARALDVRCARYEALVTDRYFVAFMRSRRT